MIFRFLTSGHDAFTTDGKASYHVAGLEGHDTLRAGSFATTFGTINPIDLLDGGSGNDVLLGNGNDQLYGGGGDDVLQGGAKMVGGDGWDTYHVDADSGPLASRITEKAGEGLDGVTIFGYGTKVNVHWLPDNVEDASIDMRVLDPGTGTYKTTNVYGSAKLYGNALKNYLSGSGGSDSIYGLGGDDNLLGDSGDDYLDGGTGNDNLKGGSGRDTLIGGDGNDWLRSGDGLAAGDVGVLEASRLEGGTGDDRYDIYGGAATVVIEAAGAGVDSVWTNLSQFVLSANVENLTFTSDPNISNYGSGNSLGNVMSGGRGYDQLAGYGGADTLRGGGDRDHLIGGDGSDRLEGDEGDDVLEGGEGADLLIGGVGKDYFAYRNVAESTDTQWDRILGFEKGVDMIDLSRVDRFTSNPQLLQFVGSEQSFFREPGEVWITEALGNSYLRVDMDGDLGHEMQIVVQGVTGLTEADLIL